MEDGRAGLAIRRVEYDDGSAGTLTISCRISNAEPGRFEGVTASKGFVDFWNRVTAEAAEHQLADLHTPSALCYQAYLFS